MANNSRNPQNPVETGRFGTFGGVFTPSVLTILGVIMFMRANFVVARAGIFMALATLIACKAIVVLTALSISGISTNTRIRGGGAYFMISRVLGPEFGGAIGLALYCAQALSVPFYILGFTEALVRTFPALDPHFLPIGLATATLLFLLAWSGAHWAIRAQYVILTVMGLSIFTFLAGSALHFDPAFLKENWSSAPEYRFWVVFAIYFPAVTGIMAGVNMSGDLKDSGRSIPLGTFAAIGVGFLVYASQMVVCGSAAARDVLQEQPYEILLQQAFLGMGFLVVAGVFLASLSSAVGSFMGAPRVLQALGRDRIFEPLRFFAKGVGPAQEPRRALLLTYAVAMGTLLLSGGGGGGGALNAVASIVTMFFLYTYGITNMAAFVESFGLNPSFRPRFRLFHWTTALLGALASAGSAFLINVPAALGAAAVVTGIFFYVRGRVLKTAFGDARRGFLFSVVRNNLLKLRALPVHAKNWRPTVLALSGNPKNRPALLHYGDWLEAGRGILTLGEVLVGEFENLKGLREGETDRLNKLIAEEELAAFPEVVVARELDDGIMALLQAHSLGPLKPNLALFGWPENPERAGPFERVLKAAYSLGMSLIVLRPCGEASGRNRSRVDIWWRGMENGSLMLILAHLIRQNWEWARAEIRVLRRMENEEGREPAAAALAELLAETRIEAQVEVVVSRAPFREVLREHSAGADLVMLGFRAAPDDGDQPMLPAELVPMLEGLPDTLLVCSTGEADATQ